LWRLFNAVQKAFMISLFAVQECLFRPSKWCARYKVHGAKLCWFIYYFCSNKIFQIGQLSQLIEADIPFCILQPNSKHCNSHAFIITVIIHKFNNFWTTRL